MELRARVLEALAKECEGLKANLKVVLAEYMQIVAQLPDRLTAAWMGTLLGKMPDLLMKFAKSAIAELEPTSRDVAGALSSAKTAGWNVDILENQAIAVGARVAGETVGDVRLDFPRDVVAR